MAKATVLVSLVLILLLSACGDEENYRDEVSSYITDACKRDEGSFNDIGYRENTSAYCNIMAGCAANLLFVRFIQPNLQSIQAWLERNEHGDRPDDALDRIPSNVVDDLDEWGEDVSYECM